MYFCDTEECSELRDTLARFHRDRPAPYPTPVGGVHVARDRDRWAALAALGAVAPQVSGLPFEAVAVTLEEAGAAVSDLPLLASAAAAELLARCGEPGARLLAEVAAGRRVAVALDGSAPWRAVTEAGVSARESSGVWTLTGIKQRVAAGATAEVVIVLANNGLFVVDSAAADLPVLDPTVPLARFEFDRTPARPLVVGAGVDRLVSQVLDRVWIGAAAELLGVAQAALDATVEFAAGRRQFGRPIGSFQAVKHRCADTHLQVSGVRTAVRYAARAVDVEESDVPWIAPMVLALALAAAERSAGDFVQLSGGMGFTWEHSAHRYLKRAATAPALFGDASWHREAMLRRRGW
jgi:alkylation response protein AidB-like acyl-CoA dehydrogenase